MDPKIVGPGAWEVSHVLALVCDESGSDEDFKFYCWFQHRLVHNFPCSKCRRHAVRYLDTHPIPKTKAEGSLYEWSVMFHNTVNKRLGKRQYSVKEAREIHENTEVIMNNPATGATCTLNPGPEAEGCEDKPLYSHDM